MGQEEGQKLRTIKNKRSSGTGRRRKWRKKLKERVRGSRRRARDRRRRGRKGTKGKVERKLKER